MRRLFNDQATRRNVLIALQEVLAEADSAIVYFAGHGVANDIGTYLATVDGSEEEEGVDVEHLRRLIEVKAAKSKLVLLILDCCHSGAAKPRTRRPASASTLARSLPLAAEGRVLLAACRAEELAEETDDGSHGVFTKCLLDAMQGGAANGDGAITLFSLHEYVAKQFAGSSQQTPLFRGDVVGSALIAEGVTPGTISPASRASVELLLREARRHLDDYQRRAPGSVSEW